MAAPREIIPGRYYMITRRCVRRQFLLRPDQRTNQCFLFCLALAAQYSGVRVVCFLAMSNHYHAIVHDPLGTLPLFLEHLHKLCAKALNARWSRWENLWATEQTCATHLVNPSDVLDKVLYTLCNPLAEHLVERVTDWPGANSYRAMLTGRTIEVERPRDFFREHGSTPDVARLTLARPPGFEDWDQPKWEEYLTGLVTGIEERTRRERLERGIKLRGRKAVLRASELDTPDGAEPRRKLRPSVACADAVARTRVLTQLVLFRRAHEVARLRVAAGELEAVFPYGTYRMRLMGHRCARAPSD
ncbi:MAG TPA: hypothetical protein VFQ61_14960 [Polyangiaceae bacterium]|nr:hypothetical protein [Polyangiaceae bacterium]